MENLPKPSDLFPRLAKIVRWLAGPQLFVSHGDHLFEHRVPFEKPVEQLPLWDDMGTYYEGDDLQNWPSYTSAPLGDPEAPNGWGE